MQRLFDTPKGACDIVNNGSKYIHKYKLHTDGALIYYVLQQFSFYPSIQQICLSIHPSNNSSISPFIHPSTYTLQFFHPSIYPSITLFIHPFIHLSLLIVIIVSTTLTVSRPMIIITIINTEIHSNNNSRNSYSKQASVIILTIINTYYTYIHSNNIIQQGF